MKGECKFKVGDFVIYGNKIEDNDSIARMFMKPAKVINIKDNLSFPIEIQLLNEDKSNWFKEAELIRAIQNEEDLGTMLIKGIITKKEYDIFIENIEV